MQIKVKGLVIRERDYSENDKILTILTREYGKLSVFAKGAKKISSRFMTAAQLFCYSFFVLRKGSGLYTLNEVEYIETFYELRCDIETLSLANYFLDVMNDVSTEEKCDEEMFSLILNALYVLTNKTRPLYIIKPAFELRLAMLTGFMPNLVACSRCAKYYDDYMFFDIMNGELICNTCKSKMNVDYTVNENEFRQAVIISVVSAPVISAMRYIAYSAPKRVFLFNIELKHSFELETVCEKYLLNHLERGFATLDFYKSIKEIK